MNWTHRLRLTRPLALISAAALVATALVSVAADPTPAAAADADAPRVRVLALTDAEIDDQSTMLRFLLYSSDYDIAGIIHQNSIWQQDGHWTTQTNAGSARPPGTNPDGTPTSWWQDQFAAYAEVYPNLVKHNPNYPTPEYILSVNKRGNDNRWDLSREPKDMVLRDTDGEKLIIDVLLDDDPRPILTGCWGGCNTLAQAIYTIQQTRTDAELQRALAKIRLYVIWYQDNGGRWIEQNFPQVQIFEAFNWFGTWDYSAPTGPSPAYVQNLMTAAWLNENVKQNHGALGEYTPQSYISEGDTPSFMGAVANGLQDGAYDFTLGNWGGRAVKDSPYLKPGHYTDSITAVVADDGDPYKHYWRWLPAVQNDFAARMDWCVEEYKDANHQPVAVARGDLNFVAQPGQVVTLDLSQSTDPDGDTLSYSFWQYADQDSVSAKVGIAGASSSVASFVVPNEPGKQIQVIGEVIDDGEPSLTTYKRWLIDIGQTYQPTAPRPADSIEWSAPQPITGESDVSTNGTLLRAVNLSNSNQSPVVNGVTFRGANYQGSSWIVPGSVRNGGLTRLSAWNDTMTTTDTGGAGGVDGLAPTTSSWSASYQQLLNTAHYNQAPADPVPTVPPPAWLPRIGGNSIPVQNREKAGFILTLNGLTPGNTYEIQLWASDQRIDNLGLNPNPDLTTLLRDQGGDVELQQNLANIGGGSGQSVIGRFTATSSSKAIEVIGGPEGGRVDNRTAILNAYQVRSIDTVSTAAVEAALDAATQLDQAAYSPSTWETLQDAVAAAQAELANPTSQTAVNTALAALNAAVAALEPYEPPVAIAVGKVEVVGTAVLGATLSIDLVNVTPADAVAAYQWRSGGVDVPGATGASYRVRPADKGARVSCVVTLSRAGSADLVVESPTAVVPPGVSQMVLSPSLDGDKHGEVLALTAAGDLLRHNSSSTGAVSPGVALAAGLPGHTVKAPGDWNGDGKADVVSVDAKGDMYLHAGSGSGSVAAPAKIGNGWLGYTVVPAGDLTQDGNADLLAIRDSTGDLYLYAGNGKGGFKYPYTKVGNGWQGYQLHSAGDVSLDGSADILSIDPAGDLFLYAG
ncbi:MAG: DUF1593 domain-containing protein, partial [Bifidobacteriaceae bacterium]|nr:DUF1593 domain-containing protein [Bifidobacteriaceae bacterium]